MLIGHDCRQLEQRVSDALCGGTLRVREADFLQSVSSKISRYGEHAFLSEKQASWLRTILASVGGKGTGQPKQAHAVASKQGTKAPLSLESVRQMRIAAGIDPDGLPPLEDSPKAFDISQAFE